MLKVAVLLPVYNAENFLLNQLDSILNQMDTYVTIFVLDDGSTDGTRDLLRTKYGNNPKVILVESNILFGRASKSFFYLLNIIGTELSKFDFVALADHDDIWGERKLTSAVKKILDLDADCYSSSFVSVWYDSRGYRKPNYINKAVIQKKYDFFFESPGPGCTFVLRSSFVREMLESNALNHGLLNKVFWHDWFIYAFARLNGYEWIIDSDSHLLYIQRGTNETGVNRGFKAYKRRFVALMSGWYIAQSISIISVIDPDSHLLKRLKRLNLLDKFWFIMNWKDVRRKKIDSLILIISILFLSKRKLSLLEKSKIF